MNPRIEKVRKRINHYGLDAFFVSSLPHIRYLFGFTGSNSLAVISPVFTFFITDRRYDEQAKQQVRDAEIVIAQHALHDELEEIVQRLAGTRIGLEAAYLTIRDYHDLKKRLPQFKFLATERIVEGVTAIKDDDEIEKITRAAEICCQVMEALRNIIKPGVSELDISSEISYRAMRLGSERDPFEPIVASGLRSALPHGVSTPKSVEKGDLIVLDFGATIEGYAADFTRTAIVGKASARQKELVEVVRQALEAAEATARPDITGQALDKVARDLLTKHGYGEYFQHSLGHGLGLNVHEFPRIGEKGTESLQAGNVITLEPGVYLPEVGGVRIEDDFVVTADGVRNLTPYSRQLLTL